MAGNVYNPASLRAIEASPGTFDRNGFVTLVLPAGSLTDLGRGALGINIAAVAAVAIDRQPLLGDQDGVNAVYTINGAKSWTLVWVVRNGQLIDTATYTVSGTGNRTVTMLMAALPDDQGGTFPEILEAIGIAT